MLQSYPNNLVIPTRGLGSFCLVLSRFGNNKELMDAVGNMLRIHNAEVRASALYAVRLHKYDIFLAMYWQHIERFIHCW